MNNPFKFSREQKIFLALFVFFGLIVSSLAIWGNRTVCLWAVCIYFTFSAAAIFWLLIHNKMLVAVTLAVSLPLLLPQQPRAQPKPQGATIGCLIVTIIVGGIVVYGMVKICDRAFPPAPPPATNPPPGTNSPPVKSSISNYWGSFSMKVESTTNLLTWTTEGLVQGAVGDGLAIFVTTDAAGHPLITNTVPVNSIVDGPDYSWSATNNVSSVIREGPSEQYKFWRMSIITQ